MDSIVIDNDAYEWLTGISREIDRQISNEAIRGAQQMGSNIITVQRMRHAAMKILPSALESIEETGFVTP